MVAMSMELKGGKALAKVLDGLKGTTARKAVRPAVRSSLSIVNKAAKSLVPTATKRLKRSIGIVMVPAAKMRNKGTIIGMVGPRVGGQHGSSLDKSTFAARYRSREPLGPFPRVLTLDSVSCGGFQDETPYCVRIDLRRPFGVRYFDNDQVHPTGCKSLC